MATAGKTIHNNISGFKLQWLKTANDTNGEYVQCRMWIDPKAYMPIRHIHPHQTETFEVVKGSLKLECDGITTILLRNGNFTVPKGKPHQWWNSSDSSELEFIVTMTPAQNWDIQMEQTFGIMNDKGNLSFMQVMAMQKEYEMYIAGPPIVLQNLLSTILYPISRLMGLKKYYPEYSSGNFLL